jgi:hypothetical protein
MPAGQNQGLQVAVIIFVILTVLSMGFAVMTATSVRELRTKAATEQRRASEADQAALSLQEELNFVKGLIGMKPADTGELPDREATEAFFQADLKKYGERLKAIEATAVEPANYTQSIDALLTVLEQRNLALEAEKAKSADLQKQKDGLDATYSAQVAQFRMQADAAEKARAEAVAKADAAEKAAELTKTTTLAEIQKISTEMEAQRAGYQKQITERDDKVAGLEVALKTKTDYIESKIERDFAATYDGQVTKVNPSTRTVWVNLGTYDNLQKHLTFSVQPQGVPPGSNLRPKGRIEVIQILDNHLAECRILEDDLSNPILTGDNIYTPLWEPGQRTRFAFAGRIDLDGDGSDDIDRVRALVSKAGGQIDAISSATGQTEGELTIETRYLVLGPIPAQREGIETYNAILGKAETLGVQRVPVSVFLDQIGYRRESDTVVFGGGAAKAPKITDLPDGGMRESTGSVNALFKQRRPPTPVGGSAY